MAEAAHLLIVVAGQHVGEMADAEPHLGAERRRQQLARDLGRVDRRRRVEAIVAIAAMLGRVLAEMAQQDRAAAARRLDQRGERVQPLALAGAALGLDLAARSAGGRARNPRAAQNSHASAGSPSRPARPVSW